jgi:hypothetical protein
LGKFWRSLHWTMLIYFMDIWDILWPFGVHLIPTFCSVLVSRTKKNLATLMASYGTEFWLHTG